MVNDIVSDMLIRINNGYISKLNKVCILYSKLNLKILALLYIEGYINGYYFNKNGVIVVKLKYHLNKNIFKSYKRISKPGRRIYFSAAELKKKYENKSFVVVSTNIGIILHKYAILKNVGGEVLFELNFI